MIFEIGLILFLLLVNGFFAMSELAVVSARAPRLEAMAAAGDRGAKKALELARDPGRLLSAVQIGITLVGVFAGAFSGATLAGPLAELLSRISFLAPAAYPVAMVVVVGSITYLSLVIGELVPKRVALRFPEQIAVLVSRPLAWIARFAFPMVFVLEGSTRAVLRIFAIDRIQPEPVSEEEVKAMIVEGGRAGVLLPEEEKLITGVMRLADRRVTALMTPRPEIEWLDLEDDPGQLRQQILQSRRSRLPVGRGSLEKLVGAIRTRDALERLAQDGPLDVEHLVQPLPMLHDKSPALAALELLRTAPMRMAMIVDEHGGLEGLMTSTDILETIIGLMREHHDGAATAVRRDDGSWLIDGDLSVDRVADILGATDLRGDGSYTTLAGFLLSKLDHLPRTGEVLEWGTHRYEVVDMDVFRIDKILVSPTRPPVQDTGPHDA